MKRILTLLAPLILGCCTPLLPVPAEIPLVLLTDSVRTRSSDPGDEEKISDLNIYIFNEEGLSEEHLFVPHIRSLVYLHLLREVRYTIVVCVNFGYAMPDFDSPDKLREYRYYLTYSDEYKSGLPMCAFLENFRLGNAIVLRVPVTRLMSRISLQIDRSQLDDDVSLTVSGVSIGNCPRSVCLGAPSKVMNKDDVLRPGFSKSGNELAALNREVTGGLSGSVDFWMLENMQGDLLEDVFEDADKVLEGMRTAAGTCSYIELKVQYGSTDYRSKPGEYLIYRFYLGENLRNFDVERNSHYTFTLVPKGSGIDGDGWRVDKSALTRN